jgi:ABC-type nitrate/sulfonate/bicarbonate transport system substrate-binding protein
MLKPLLLLCVVFMQFSVTAIGAQERKIRFGITARSMGSLPLVFAQSGGFYQAEGLYAEFIQLSPTLAVQAQIAEELEFNTVTSVAARAAIAGMPVNIVMAITTGSDHVLVVAPGIRRIEDLKGRTVGVAALKDITDVSTRTLLKKYGLNADTDVRIVAVPGSPARLAALQSGNIDGTVLSLPYNKMALRLGFRELFAMKDLIRIPNASLSTNLKLTRSDPDLIIRTLKATLRSIRVLKKNKNRFLDVVDQELKIRDRELGGLVYESALDLLSDTGIPSDMAMVETIASAREVLGIVREVRASQVFNFSLLEKALGEIRRDPTVR